MAVVMRWIVLVVGVLVALVGLLWALQGAGVIGGSMMSGQKTWLVIGLIALVVGIAVAWFGLRRLGRA